jgi:methionyl-tRNA formyltransferase
VRALSPHIGAHIELADGGRLGVVQARALERTGLRAGELDTSGQRPLLGCGSGALELMIVQPPGKRPMAAEDYLRGLRR